MADPLSLLRLHKIHKKPIIENNDHVIFGEYSWPKTVKTNYLVRGKKGSPKQYYTLECLLFFLENVQLPHPVYCQKAQAAGKPFVRRPDRKVLLSYLSGITSTSPSIDEYAPTVFPTTVKSEQNHPEFEDSKMKEISYSSSQASTSFNMDTNALTEIAVTVKQERDYLTDSEKDGDVKQTKDKLVARLDAPKRSSVITEQNRSLSDAMSVESIAAIRAKRLAKTRSTVVGDDTNIQHILDYDVDVTQDIKRSLSDAMPMERIAAIRAKRLATTRSNVAGDDDVQQNYKDIQHILDYDEDVTQDIKSHKSTGKTGDISSEDVKETVQLVNQIPALTSEVMDVIDGLARRLENRELDTRNGLSILDLKNLNLLDYITNLTYIMLKKVSGERIEGDPAVKRLAELRVMMEKVRPIEEKIKYEVNKLVASVSSENTDSNDPLRYRANPESLDAQDDDNESEGDQKKRKVYVPPKISTAYYDEDNIQAKKEKALDHAKKRALSSSMLYELRKEFDTGPEEIKEMRDPYRMKITEEIKERERFEEEYMMRLPMTKQQRHEMRQLTTVTNFNSDVSGLEMTPDSLQLKKKFSTKKGKSKYRGKKKSGSKRKR